MENEYDPKRWLFLLRIITMKKFRQKNFGGMVEGLRKAKGEVKRVGGRVKDFYKRNETAGLTTVTATMSTGNFLLNSTRKSQDKEYQDKQINAMKNLTNALSDVDKNLKRVDINPKKIQKEENKRKFSFRRLFSNTEKNNVDMVKFRPKNFSILSNTLTGAAIGANVGALLTPSLSGTKKNPVTIKVSNPKFVNIADKYNNSSMFAKRLGIVAGGTILGAALGALVGSIKEVDKFISRKTTVDNRLMSKVVGDLKKTGFEEGTDFTRDPKTADRIKSQVSIAITKNSGELRLLVNTIADKKLKDITSQVIRNLPNSSAVTREERNRYNEISITTISDGSADVGLIAGICEKFIRNKYPVYLVEVG